jgi:hypothetical protein
MKSLEMLKRKVADTEAAQAAAKMHCFNFLLFLVFAGQGRQALKLRLKLRLRRRQE